MASRTMNARAQEFGVKVKKVRCRIFPQNTGTPLFESPGGVASVARSAAGKFLITLQDGYKSCIGFQASFTSEEDNRDMYAQGGAISNLNTTSAVTAVVKLKTGATNTDIAASGTSRYIDVSLVFEDSNA